MTLLIFSCNRALQLDALLRSLLTYLTVAGNYSVQVLYAATTDRYELGYQQLSQTYPTVRFHREGQHRHWIWPRPFGYWKNMYRYLNHSGLRRTSNFKTLTEKIIAESPHEGILFLTDDSLFTRPVCLDDARINAVVSDPAHGHSLSLRHGLTLSPIPTDCQRDAVGGCVWHVQPNVPDLAHWTWRFSIDGHLYPRRALLPILRRLNYANPNSLEGFVNEYIVGTRPDLFRTLLFDEQPALVGFILNKVQTYNGNHNLDVSPTYLNDKFLAGYRLHYRYREPATDFQPMLEAIELVQSGSGKRNSLLLN